MSVGCLRRAGRGKNGKKSGKNLDFHETIVARNVCCVGS
jgi:hypothetical protein